MKKELPAPQRLNSLQKKALQATCNILTKDGKYGLSIEQLETDKKIIPTDIAMRLGSKSKDIGEVMETLTDMGFYKKSGEAAFPKYMPTPEAVNYLSRNYKSI